MMGANTLNFLLQDKPEFLEFPTGEEEPGACCVRCNRLLSIA